MVPEQIAFYDPGVGTMSSPVPFRGWPGNGRYSSFRRRTIRDGATLHQSVLDRKNHPGGDYNPPNLPGNFDIEP